MLKLWYMLTNTGNIKVESIGNKGRKPRQNRHT